MMFHLNEEQELLISEFVDLILIEKYFEAHELLEKNLWDKKSKNKLNLYFKGLINSAVAMQLYKLNRKPQSRKVFNTFLKYKIDIPMFYNLNLFIENYYLKLIS